MKHALEGIRVVELGEGVSAPYCAQALRRLRRRRRQDRAARPATPPARWGPFPGDAPHPEKSGLFFFLNTNKRGITLDLEPRQRGRELARALARRRRRASIENRLPGARARARASTTRRSPRVEPGPGDDLDHAVRADRSLLPSGTATT